VGRDNSVGIAIRYELRGPGIESWWNRDFLQPCRPVLQSTVLLQSGYHIFLPRVKRSGRGANHPPPPSSAKVKDRVELYTYSVSGPSWPVQGQTLHMTFYIYVKKPKPFTRIVLYFKQKHFGSAEPIALLQRNIYNDI
jgi:hypothetical protein